MRLSIAKAADTLLGGGLIAYPTDSVYGLGCDFTQKKAVERIYQIKRMPKGHPLAFVCETLSQLVFRAKRLISTQVKRRRTVTGDDPQLPQGFYLLN